MLAARIHMAKKLVDANSRASASIAIVGQKAVLTITIELTDQAFILADDEDATTDPDLRANYRDARMSAPLLKLAGLKKIEIQQIDPAQGPTTFLIEGTIGTKVPGTGEDFREIIRDFQR